MEVGAIEGRRFDAVVLDFDGTLVDSHAAMVRAYTRWADEFSVDLRELPKYLGMPTGAVTRALLPAEVFDVAAARIEELEVTDTDGVVPLPGSHETLALLGRRCAIATSCTRPLLESRIRAAGLPEPHVVVTRDDVAEGKPAPDSFLRAAERLGVAPDRVLVIEDAPAGVAAARAAGSAVLGILTTRTASELGADAHAPNLASVAWHVDVDGISFTVV